MMENVHQKKVTWSSKIIWGTYCGCGTECSSLEEQLHPWDNNSDCSIDVICKICGESVSITQKDASQFYTDKILSFFSDLSGVVVDFGCGGGLLTECAASQSKVRKVYAVDPDRGNRSSILVINLKTRYTAEFLPLSDKGFVQAFDDDSVDALICRDVMMFIEDPASLLNHLCRIVRQEIRIMGWYQPENSRVKNSMHPESMAQLIRSKGWSVRWDSLDWYSYGYFIIAEKKIAE